MAASEDLINFDIIETQKENIQSLPSGRSAKTLASIFSPAPLGKTLTPTPSDTRNLNDSIRQEFEAEILSIAESDDPLDVYDRYVKWTLDAYPSAQATPQSQLLPLLERATKAFLTSSHYKNDPRYLRLWLHYILLFSDSPRETFSFLARHNLGEGLALFYEEFAAWLEGAGRWTQADEVYKLGIEREARPAERLMRKFNDFQLRLAQRPQSDSEPSSPGLPTVRPALAAKVDPFASSTSQAADPQATRPTSALGTSTTPRSGHQKMAIFSDADAGPSDTKVPSGETAQGWESIGSLAHRKKENVVEARPWVGETLNVGKKQVTAPKMMIFKDEVCSSPGVDLLASLIPALIFTITGLIVGISCFMYIQSLPQSSNSNSLRPMSALHQQHTVNPRTGKAERVFANLAAVYPDGDDPSVEMSFEELRAQQRGWLDQSWPRTKEQHLGQTNPDDSLESEDSIDLIDARGVEQNFDPDQNRTLQIGGLGAEGGSREGQMARSKKLKVKEVKGETQTSMWPERVVRGHY